MGISNFSKTKVFSLIAGQSVGTPLAQLFIGFANSGSEVLPYATRPTIDFSYNSTTKVLSNQATTLGIATQSVASVDAVRIYDAASGGNILFEFTNDASGDPISFSFNTTDERKYSADALVIELKLVSGAKIADEVLDQFANYIIGNTITSVSSGNLVLGLFDGATEVTANFTALDRQPITLNTATGLNSNEANFGDATTQTNVTSARLYDDTTGNILVTDAVLTPTTITAFSGDGVVVRIGNLSIDLEESNL